MKARAIIFEWAEKPDGPMMVRDIYESTEEDALGYAIEMEAEADISMVHVEYVE